MPRRRYYRRAVRVVPAKKKWASNLVGGSIGTSGSGLSDNATLVQNSTQASTPTPIIVKTGNFKIQGDCYLTVSAGANYSNMIAQVYILYTPEGIQIDFSTVVFQHPEWVMGWTQLDLPITSSSNTSAGNRFTVSSRLKRNLNSGDKIRLIIVGGGTNVTISCNFTCQYFTCAN